MSTESHPPEDPSAAGEAEPVLTLIKRIKENRLDPCLLSAEDRRRCVEVLRGEGYSVPEIGQILKRAERTIHRDLAALRAANALQVHPQFPLQMAGEMLRQAECSIGRLRRIAREPSASAMERLTAESSAWRVFADLIGKLQSLGYLPRVPTGVVAQVVDQAGGDPIATYDQLAQRLKELDQVDREIGLQDAEHTAQRRTLMEMVQRGRLSAQVEQSARRKPEDN